MKKQFKDRNETFHRRLFPSSRRQILGGWQWLGPYGHYSRVAVTQEPSNWVPRVAYRPVLSALIHPPKEMRNPRLANVVMSDDEDESPCIFSRPNRPAKDADGGGGGGGGGGGDGDGEAGHKNKKRRIIKPPSEEDEEVLSKREVVEEKDAEDKDGEDAAGLEEEEDEKEEVEEDAKPIGEPVRVTGKGRGRREHYEAVEFDGNRYELVSSRAFAVYPVALQFCGIESDSRFCFLKSICFNQVKQR